MPQSLIYTVIHCSTRWHQLMTNSFVNKLTVSLWPALVAIVRVPWYLAGCDRKCLVTIPCGCSRHYHNYFVPMTTFLVAMALPPTAGNLKLQPIFFSDRWDRRSHGTVYEETSSISSSLWIWLTDWEMSLFKGLHLSWCIRKLSLVILPPEIYSISPIFDTERSIGETQYHNEWKIRHHPSFFFG